MNFPPSASSSLPQEGSFDLLDSSPLSSSMSALSGSFQTLSISRAGAEICIPLWLAAIHAERSTAKVEMTNLQANFIDWQKEQGERLHLLKSGALINENLLKQVEKVKSLVLRLKSGIADLNPENNSLTRDVSDVKKLSEELRAGVQEKNTLKSDYEAVQQQFQKRFGQALPSLTIEDVGQVIEKARIESQQKQQDVDARVNAIVQKVARLDKDLKTFKDMSPHISLAQQPMSPLPPPMPNQPLYGFPSPPIRPMVAPADADELSDLAPPPPRSKGKKRRAIHNNHNPMPSSSYDDVHSGGGGGGGGGGGASERDLSRVPSPSSQGGQEGEPIAPNASRQKRRKQSDQAGVSSAEGSQKGSEEEVKMRSYLKALPLFSSDRDAFSVSKLHQHIIEAESLTSSQFRSFMEGLPLAQSVLSINQLVSGWSPLHLLIRRGEIHLIKTFIEKESTTDLRQVTGFGWNALHLMSFYKNLNDNATTAAVKELMQKIVASIGQSGLDALNHPNAVGNTPCQLAAYRGNERMLDLLIILGADINFQDEQGRTALHYAVAGKGKNRLETVRIILETEYADINLRCNQGKTALMEAADRADLELIEAFLGERKSKDCNLTIQDNLGRTALYYAKNPVKGKLDKSSRQEVIKLLTEKSNHSHS